MTKIYRNIIFLILLSFHGHAFAQFEDTELRRGIINIRGLLEFLNSYDYRNKNITHANIEKFLTGVPNIASAGATFQDCEGRKELLKIYNSILEVINKKNEIINWKSGTCFLSLFGDTDAKTEIIKLKKIFEEFSTFVSVKKINFSELEQQSQNADRMVLSGMLTCPPVDNSKKSDADKTAKWNKCFGKIVIEFDGYSKGDVYEGEYNNGKLNGLGTHKYVSGNIYTGMFKDGIYHGQGTLISANGIKFIGNFKDGRRNGYGIEKYEDNGSIKREGTWDGFELVESKKKIITQEKK